MFPGRSQIYKSADTVDEDDMVQTYPTELLNSLALSGLPPHEMELKEGSPVMLLCNLHVSPGNSLCNGRKMVIQHLGEHIIEAEIASGVNKGKSVIQIEIMP